MALSYMRGAKVNDWARDQMDGIITYLANGEALHLEDMYINYANTLNLPLFFYQKHGKVAKEALLDSGAMENFVDHQTIVRWRIGMTKLDKP